MARGPVAWLLVVGCGGDLLPGEQVLGEEVPVAVVEGSPGEDLGVAVAAGLLDGAPAVLVAAPGAGRVDHLDPAGRLVARWWGPVGFGLDVAIADGRAVAIEPGVGVRRLDDGELLVADGDARHIAACPGGEIRTAAGDDADVACGPGGEDLRRSCDGDRCVVLLDGEELAVVEAGGAVAFDGDRACWGEIMAAEPTGTGRVRCADGTEIVGLEGEHLGASMAGGDQGEALAAGVFDKWIVPARARIHPIGGGTVLAVDQADENARLALARGSGLVAVGVAGYRRGADVAGRVFIVDADAIGGGG